MCFVYLDLGAHLVGDTAEYRRHARHKVAQPVRQVSLGPAHIVVVVRVGAQRGVVGRQVLGIELFQAVEAAQVVAVAVEDERGQRPRTASAASRSDRFSNAWKISTRINWAGERPGAPCTA